jgi:DnaK suppressor protein
MVISSLERLLLARRNQLLREAVARWEADHELARSADWMDLASQSHEREITSRLRQTQSHLLRAIEDALHRIRRGNFGVCVNCGHRIGQARLRAVPWTRLCLACKAQEK